MDIPLGLMFHHFHDDVRHHPSQGSLGASEFKMLLAFWTAARRILSPEEWLAGLREDRLRPSDSCLTFDDGLKCQFDIALPVLEEMGLRAFWFIHSLPLCGGVDTLEAHRLFHSRCFTDVDAFYSAFFSEVNSQAQNLDIDVETKRREFVSSGHLSDRSMIYSDEDRCFRYFRDIVLGEENYRRVMASLQEKAGFNPASYRKMLWMNRNDVTALADRGHIVGLHTHSHPTLITRLTSDEQLREYAKNQEILEDITGDKCICAAYPCGMYTDDTDEILRSLGVVAAFDCMPHSWQGPLHLPRFDHALVWKNCLSQPDRISHV